MSDPDIDVKAYPGEEGTEIQQVRAGIHFLSLLLTEHLQVEETLAQTLIYYQPFNLLPGHLQAYAFGAASMIALPNITEKANAIKTLQSEAEHFRRGIRTHAFVPTHTVPKD